MFQATRRATTRQTTSEARKKRGFGHEHYEHGQYEEAVEALPFEYQTLRIDKYVAGQIELSRRRDNLSWSHHAEVALHHREAAKLWIYRHARGQRNLTPEQDSYLRGKQYELEKKAHGGDRIASGQNVHLISPKKTHERLAEEHDVNPKTIQRDAQFAKAVDKIAETVGKDQF